jgi:hypothetical protein
VGETRWGVAALLVSALAGCAEPPMAAYACLLPSEQRMLVAELFFGRTIRGRGPLGDAEWSEFAAQTLTPNFPDGFTVTDGNGQWQNPATREITRQPSKIVLVAARRTPDLGQRLTAVIDAYKTRFNQQSVGIITRDSCAAF